MGVEEKIKITRNKKGLSTNDLAKLTGISQSTISKLENGKRSPDLTLIEKIADALGVSLDYLVGDSPKSLIEARIKELNITIEQLAEKSNAPLQFLNNLDDIQPNESDYKYIISIANALNIQPNLLTSAFARQEPPAWDGPITNASSDFNEIRETIDVYNAIKFDKSDIVNIPIVGIVRAGLPILATENIEGYQPTLKNSLCTDKDYFYLRVQGDSMDQEFNEGSLLLIEKTPQLENGQIGVILIDGLDATVKKVIQNENMITLIPMSNNSEHIPHMYDVVKDEIRIVGRVKEVVKKYY